MAILPGSTAEEHSFSNLNSYVESLWYSRLVQLAAKRAHRAANLAHQLCLKGGKVADKAEQNV